MFYFLKKRNKTLWGFFFLFLFFFVLLGIFLLKPTESSAKSVVTTPKNSLLLIPYASWLNETKVKTLKSGVTTYKKSLAYPGIHLCFNDLENKAELLDMEGNTVHVLEDKRKGELKRGWRLVKPYQDSQFLVLQELSGLFLIDWNSNVIWEKKFQAHHDFDVTEEGDILVLVNNQTRIPELNTSEEIYDNWILTLSSEGNIISTFSFAELLFKKSHNIFLELAKTENHKEYLYEPYIWDLFHTNTLKILKEPVVLEEQLLFEEGMILFCMRHLNLIGVFDIKQNRLLWSWGWEELDNPHSPVFLKNGHLVVFDNGTNRGYSRILELNPISKQIVWEYQGSPPESFFSPIQGAIQVLPNDHLLVVNSYNAHVFELTPQKKVVWEFHRNLLNPNNTRKAFLYRFPRLWDSFKYPYLNALLPK